MLCSDYSYTLTADELVVRLRQQRAMEPVDDGFARTDSAGALRRMKLRLRAIYLEALSSLPLEMLPLTDVAPDVIVTIDSADSGMATLRLPPAALRLASVRLDGWKRNATILPADAPQAAAQDAPLARAGVYSPVAIVGHGGALRLYPAATTLASLLCVVATADDTYLLTPQLEKHILDNYD